MKNYERPFVEISDERAEGVFAASGEAAYFGGDMGSSAESNEEDNNDSAETVNNSNEGEVNTPVAGGNVNTEQGDAAQDNEGMTDEGTQGGEIIDQPAEESAEMPVDDGGNGYEDGGDYGSDDGLDAEDFGGYIAEPSYSLEEVAAWDGNKQYDLYLTNNSDVKMDEIVINVPINGVVLSVGGNVDARVGNGVVTISFKNWGNGFQPGETVGPIYVAVTGTGDFSLD